MSRRRQNRRKQNRRTQNFRRANEKLTPETLPLFRDYSSAVYDMIWGAIRRAVDGAPEEAFWLTEREIEELRGSEMAPQAALYDEACLWWVTPDMTNEIVDALRLFTAGADPLRSFCEQAPSRAGFLIWEGGLGNETMRDRGKEWKIIGATWGIKQQENGLRAIYCSPIISDPSRPMGALLTEANTVAEHNRVSSLLMAALEVTWRLAKQPKLSETVDQVSLSHRSWSQRQGREVSTVKITRLRKTPQTHSRSERGGHARYSHRFVVRGHWRTLRNGGKTWVREHIKGPADKPLILKEHLYLLRA